MGDNYYSYKSETFSCTKCGWVGLGIEIKQGDMFDAGFEVYCPKCGNLFSSFIMFPTIEETFEKGSEVDKIVALKVKAFREKWLDSSLKDSNQLPDLHYQSMTFVLREIEEDNEKYIVITQRGKIIWKEILTYEYYKRFIELGKLFKQKYGENIFDLVPDVDGTNLYGDKLHSVRWVENFRKELRAQDSTNA